MKCRNCNNEVSEKDKNCPYCNTPLNNNDTDNGPTLGRGMVGKKLRIGQNYPILRIR